MCASTGTHGEGIRSLIENAGSKWLLIGPERAPYAQSGRRRTSDEDIAVVPPGTASIPNQHLTNRRAFATLDGTDPGLKVYCSLVALELALKDRDVAHLRLGHKVCQMIRNAFATAKVGVLVSQLEAHLKALPCSDKQGQAATVRPEQYPDLRYVRRDGDFSGGVGSQVLEGIKKVLDDLIAELKKEGLQWP